LHEESAKHAVIANEAAQKEQPAPNKRAVTTKQSSQHKTKQSPPNSSVSTTDERDGCHLHTHRQEDYRIAKGS
jgi:hypothetical protein